MNSFLHLGRGVVLDKAEEQRRHPGKNDRCQKERRDGGHGASGIPIEHVLECLIFGQQCLNMPQ